MVESSIPCPAVIQILEKTDWNKTKAHACRALIEKLSPYKEKEQR
ncbi:MAG: hypothetical protein R3B44_14945 [Candidatus Brocadiaceae bacterium]